MAHSEHIIVSLETKYELMKMGSKEDSFNDIVSRLLETYKKGNGVS